AVYRDAAAATVRARGVVAGVRASGQAPPSAPARSRACRQPLNLAQRQPIYAQEAGRHAPRARLGRRRDTPARPTATSSEGPMELCPLEKLQHRIQVGVPLPFSVRDGARRLLRARNEVIADAVELAALTDGGAFVDLDEQRGAELQDAAETALPALWRKL